MNFSAQSIKINTLSTYIKAFLLKSYGVQNYICYDFEELNY